MGSLAALVKSPFADALAWTLIHFLWEGALIGFALWAGIALLQPRSARIRYALGCLALVAMLLSFGATLAVNWPDPILRFPAPVAGIAVPESVGSGAPAQPLIASPDLVAWVTPFWMAGVLLFYVRLAGGWLAAERLRWRAVVVVSGEWQLRLRQLAARLGLKRVIALRESGLAAGPAVVGYLRPAILIPAGLLAGLPPEQIEAILLHELAHIRRHDYAINFLQTLVEGLFFYHPAVWWVSKSVRAEREHCCDDAVVAVMGNPRSYAAALAAVEQRRLAPQPALAAGGGSLVKRIRRLLEPERPRSIVAPLLAACLLLGGVAFGLSAWQPAAPNVSVAPAAQPVGQPAARRPVSVVTAQMATPSRLGMAAQVQQMNAQLQDPYKKWLQEDVVYIIQPEEKVAFEEVQTNPEREMFIEQFWLRRDPTPGTVENEFKEEHYRRISYANGHFIENVPGWKTHRGMYYIMFGPPDEIEDHTSAQPRFQTWRYREMRGEGPAIIVFTDVNGTGDYVLPKHTEAQQIIMARPPMSEPNIANVSGRNLNLHFAVPAGQTLVYGRVETPEGKPVTVFEEPAAPPSYVKTIPLPPGKYRLWLYFGRAGEGAFPAYPQGKPFDIQ